MRIPTKVRLGFAAVLLLFVAFGEFANDRMSSMSSHFSQLAEEAIPTLGLSAEMTLVLGQIRMTEAIHVLEKDSGQMDALSAEITHLESQMRDLEARYKPLITTPEQKTVFERFARDFDGYVNGNKAMLEHSSRGENDVAFAELLKGGPLYSDVVSRIADLDRLTRSNAEQAASAGHQVFSNTRQTTLIVVLALAAALIIGALLFNRAIITPIRMIIDAINRLARGDLEIGIPTAKRADELGDIARALESFRDNALEKERLQKQERDDLNFARNLQLASVPRRFPAFPERRDFDICGRLMPTRAVGGDFFDFYFIDARRLAIAIGDASGKGVASAMFVGMARSALKSESLRAAHPAACLGEANRLIAADNETMMFMTTFHAVLDLTSGELSFANAGHNPPYRLLAAGKVEPMAVATGIPLGVSEEFDFAAQSCRLAPGDAVVLYTDGVTEAENASGELFGVRRLESVLAQHRAERCDELVEGVMRAVRDFATGTSQADDIAVLVLRYNGSDVAAASRSGRTNEPAGV